MLRSTMIVLRNSDGTSAPWYDDPAKVREYLRIYRDARNPDEAARLPVVVVARDYGYTPRNIQLIIGKVEDAVKSGILEI